MLAGSFSKWDANRPGIERCGAFFLDLAETPPPDSAAPVARAAVSLWVVK
jgi:hypothetical protein